MKIYTATLFTATYLLSSALLAKTLTFEINNIKNDQGKILIQLFNSEKNYNDGKSHTANIINATKGKATITFNNLEAGAYAIRYFHDENENSKMETNLFGMPTEGYGFSNNAKANFGPPTFEQMKFIVKKANVSNHSSISY